MDRFQKALNKIVKSCCPNCNNEKGCSSCDIEKTCNCTAKSWVDTLQELVDKATPKKVCCTYAPHPTIEYDQEFEYYYCPTCEEWLDERDVNYYCPICGQKLDWSDE